MDQASEAIDRSKQGSEMGSAFGRDNDRSVRSKSSKHSKMSSLVALSNKVRQQGREPEQNNRMPSDLISNAGKESLGSKQ